ncbi:hypothetical protein Patl1_25725 [Pistacia atlantica]|uniref:Uncharacterized protein n=1 Tax=Pistacia atlantica TaxID=434234 RepID=A0ACC1B012_9ROSI|nr:hypothetical protein Patl1_25725 [Pistacia atlantica]
MQKRILQKEVTGKDRKCVLKQGLMVLLKLISILITLVWGSVHHKIESMMTMEVLHKEINRAVTCVAIAAKEQPPPSVIGASCVYVMLRPDKKLYVGQTDDLDGRIRSHRSKEGMQTASFLYFKWSRGRA